MALSRNVYISYLIYMASCFLLVLISETDSFQHLSSIYYVNVVMMLGCIGLMDFCGVDKNVICEYFGQKVYYEEYR